MRARSIVVLLILLPIIALCQSEWKRSYSLPYGSFSYQAYEHYDNGFLTGGMIRRQTGPWCGYIVKTDINGIKLWQKIIDGYKDSDFTTINSTIDGGVIAGGRYDIDNKYMAYVMKFNACAELEWCCFLPEENNEGSEIYSSGIYQLPDGGYICERIKTVWEHGHRWSLIKLRENGTVEWINWYDLNMSWMAQIDIKMMVTSDSCFLVTSSVYDTIRPDGALSEMPLWYKVDNQGNMLWQTKWELREPQAGSEARYTVEDNNGNYYCGGYICPWKTSIIYKLGHDGDTLEKIPFNDTIPGFIAGQINTMHHYNDTTLIIGSQFFDSPESNHWALNIADTLGNRKNRIYEKENFIFTNTIITNDKKILVVGVQGSTNGSFPYDWFSLYKFNMNLEYDSIYTMSRTYDSLCPHPIVSDTIPMPGICTFVSLPEPVNKSDLLQIKVYPNPASEYVTIEIPEFSVSTTKGGYVTQQQFRPLTGEVQLSIIDLSGQIVKTEAFDASERNHVIKVNMLTPGMYMLHLTQKGKFVAKGKVMVVR